MSPAKVLLALLCVLAISCGQLLFKRAGVVIETANSWWSWQVFGLIALAGAIYGAATLAWIGLLRVVPLSTAYSFMALSFVLVPLASQWFFSEKLSINQWLGSALIIAGLLVATRGA